MCAAVLPRSCRGRAAVYQAGGEPPKTDEEKISGSIVLCGPRLAGRAITLQQEPSHR